MDLTKDEKTSIINLLNQLRYTLEEGEIVKGIIRKLQFQIQAEGSEPKPPAAQPEVVDSEAISPEG